MANNSTLKMKMLALWEILRADSDGEHPLSTNEICAKLRARGIPCERKSVSTDVRLLRQHGYEVESVKIGRNRVYWVPERGFSVPELKILIDALQAAAFIPENQTAALAEKVAFLGGSHRAEILKEYSRSRADCSQTVSCGEDRRETVMALDEPACLDAQLPEEQIAAFTEQTFKMFGGEAEEVTPRFANALIIRKETPADYYETEHMVMRAFWNIHDPGCNEHLLVHKLRTAEDYLPELSRVAELDGRIVGAIFYSKAKVVDGESVHEILTFGPLAVEPTCCNLGVGARLLEETTALAKAAGYPGIVILGEPDYYPKHGFKTCDHYGIVHPDIGNCDPFMALPLSESFAKVHGFFYESPVFAECEDEAEIAAFTKGFPYYEPLKLPCQWLHAEKLGRISAVENNRYLIRFWEQEIPAKLDGAFHGPAPDRLPAVGDYVTFLYHRDGDSVILAVWERSGDPLPYRRLTRYLPVLETDETLYDEENGYSEVIFRFMEDLELACEKEPENENLQTMKQIFDQEENDPGHIFRHLDEIISGLKALEP